MTDAFLDEVPHILQRFTQRQQQREAEQKLAQLLLASGEAVTSTSTMAAHATAAGDPHRLRGIPAIGYSVPGAIPGSNPLAALLTKHR